MSWRVMASLVATLVLGASTGACNCTGNINGNTPGSDSGVLPPLCQNGTDNDGDGYGDGCEAGPDCNDSAFGINPGAAEICNYADDNCDGVDDEGVINSCGNCEPGCSNTEYGANPFPGPWDQPPPSGVEASGVGLDPNGDIILDETSVASEFLWVANENDYGRGTVSKINSTTMTEVARYYSTTCYSTAGGGLGNCVDINGTPVQLSANRPSRTAVDITGDAWVANRAFGGQASLTKYANDPINCIDRNANGMIDTSSDVNGNGIIDNDPSEFLGDEDECALLTVNFGNTDDVGRSLALDAGALDGGAGNPWACTHTRGTNECYRFDGNSGALTGTVVLPAGINPYGMAIDSEGIAWVAEFPNDAGGVAYFDTNTLMSGVVVNPDAALLNAAPACPSGQMDYGIGMDGNDDIWLGGWTCASAFRYSPDRTGGFASLGTGTWTRVTLTGRGNGRGIAADTRGFVWMAHDSSPGKISRIPVSVASGLVDGSGFPEYTLTGNGTIGAGVDFNENIWGVNHGSNNATRLIVDAVGNVMNPTPTPGTDDVTVGANPYSYSDFTGFGLRNFTNPTGTYEVVIEGCGAPTTWLGVTWSATEPPGTSVVVYARTADDIASLNAAAAAGPYDVSPADLLGMPPAPPMPNPSNYIKVTFVLSTTIDGVTPILHDFQVGFSCPIG